MTKRRCLIFNPAAKGDKAARFRQDLGKLADCQLKPTTAAGAARELAAEAVREEFDTIIAAGGDGTLHEVLNGIGDVPGGFDRIRLGVMPLGTANVFALETGIPSTPQAAWEVVERGNEKSIDLPEITFQTKIGSQTRYFLQMAGAGLDAHAVELVDWELKRKLGVFAYVWATLKALKRSRGVIQVSSDTKSSSGEMVIISNGKYYGGKFTLCPEANYTDGLLDLCVFQKVTWVRLPFYSLAALTDRLAKQKITVNFQARTIQLNSDARVPLQLDGEAVGWLPATIRVHPRRLRILVP
jgi:YegS/Rv2252/BmrU family lipid kinase